MKLHAMREADAETEKLKNELQDQKLAEIAEDTYMLRSGQALELGKVTKRFDVFECDLDAWKDVAKTNNTRIMKVLSV